MAKPQLIKFIAHEAKEKDVYFVCGCEAEDRCHRLVLMDKFSDM